MAAPPICILHGLYGLDPEALKKLKRSPLLGQVVGDKYALIDVIGAGGVGAVYHGLQMPLGRPVAVKVLRTQHMRDPEHKARFWHEAKALSQLKSPHTVQLFDFGVVPDGPLANVAYIVMELVEGRSLANVLTQHGPLAPTYVADVLAQVSLALTEAHRLGIVHRDLKPGNLMITEIPDGGRLVKVIDFGLAMSTDEPLSKPDTVMGTFKYVAPEQVFRREGFVADHRVDVYSMACVCWKLLTGRAPIENDAWQALLKRKLDGPPPPLPGSDDDARLAALDQVLRKALRPHPDQRHQSMAEFAEAFFSASLTEGGAPRTDPARQAPFLGPRPGGGPTPPPTGLEHSDVALTPRPDATPQTLVKVEAPFVPVRLPTPTPWAVAQAEKRRTTSISLPIIAPPSPRSGSPAPSAKGVLLFALVIFVALLWMATQDGLEVRSSRATTAGVQPALGEPDGAETPKAKRSLRTARAPATVARTSPVAAPPPRRPSVRASPTLGVRPAKRWTPPAAKAAPPPTATAGSMTSPAASGPRPTSTPESNAARAQAARVTQALQKCSCSRAAAAGKVLGATPEGRRLLAGLKSQLDRCEVPDVDQRCVQGRVVD